MRIELASAFSRKTFLFDFKASAVENVSALSESNTMRICPKSKSRRQKPNFGRGAASNA